MNRMKFLLPLILAAALMSCTGVSSPAEVKGGVADLNRYDFDSGRVLDLRGKWKFFPDELKDPSGIAGGGFDSAGNEASVPAEWNGLGKSEIPGGMTAHGKATYAVRIDNLPEGKAAGLYFAEAGTAYRLYVIPADKTQVTQNDYLPLMGNGLVSGEKNLSVPQYFPQKKIFYTRSTSVYVIVQISNFHHGKTGGFWEPLYFGSEADISSYSANRLFQVYFILGILFISLFHYILFYVFRRHDRSSLYFAVFCFFIAVRFIITERLPVIWFFPEPDALVFEILSKAEYLTVCMLPMIFYEFINSVFPSMLSGILRRILWGASALFAAVIAVAKLDVYSFVLIPYQVLIALLSIYIGAMLFKEFLRGDSVRKQGAGYLLAGMFIFIFSVMNDILSSNEIIQTPYVLTYGFVVFVLSQSLLLSLKSNWLFNYIEKMNVSLSRFVPVEFIKYLGKDTLLDVNLGDAIRRDMTVLFSDIRSFTSISEKMTPDENFNFLNSYLREISPVIRENSGFIDKFIGDGIMALFPESPADAVRSAVEMIRRVELFNRDRIASGKPLLKIGIGIHTGSLMLGTIGEEKRIDYTVISDAVNISSRLENLTKKLGTDIIISSDVRNHEDMKLLKSEIVRIGVVKVKGRTEPLEIYRVVV